MTRDELNTDALLSIAEAINLNSILLLSSANMPQPEKTRRYSAVNAVIDKSNQLKAANEALKKVELASNNSK